MTYVSGLPGGGLPVQRRLFSLLGVAVFLLPMMGETAQLQNEIAAEHDPWAILSLNVRLTNIEQVLNEKEIKQKHVFFSKTHN